MKTKYIVLGGCILCLLTGCGDRKTSQYELGAQALTDKDYSSAVEDFELAAAENDHVVEAFRGEGIAYSRMGKYEEAEKSFQSALEQSGKASKSLKADILCYLITIQYQQGKYEESLTSCDQLFALTNSKEAYFLRGCSRLHLNQYEEAASDFSKVIAQSKDYDDYIDIYHIYKECDMKADGEIYLEQALEIQGKGQEEHYNRGRIYYYLEEYDKSKEELQASCDAGNQEAAIYLGKLYAELGDTETAKSMYKECLDEKGYEAKAYNGIAYCCILEQDYTAALENINKGLAVGDDEEKQSLLFNEIVVYEKTSDFVTAKEKMKTYLELYPTDAAAVKENYFLETR
ncbi:MAG: tetratricopeptide repeat protein [Blautia sp.]